MCVLSRPARDGLDRYRKGPEALSSSTGGTVQVPFYQFATSFLAPRGVSQERERERETESKYCTVRSSTHVSSAVVAEAREQDKDRTGELRKEGRGISFSEKKKTPDELIIHVFHNVPPALVQTFIVLFVQFDKLEKNF